MSRTLEEAIKHAEYIAGEYSGAVSVCWSANDNRQLAAWLRELQERRKADSCEGCVNESGKSNLLICYTCRRHWHYADLYKQERRVE